MSLISCPSVDINFLSPNSFMLQIERIPNVSFFAQTVAIPGVSLPPLEQSTSLVNIRLPSDKLTFEPLQIPFLVDEKMQNWGEIFKWMQGLGHPESHDQYRIENQSRQFIANSEEARNYSDATLMILDSHNNPIKEIQFLDCFPVSLGEIQFSSTNTDVSYATCVLTLEYTLYKVRQ